MPIIFLAIATAIGGFACGGGADGRLERLAEEHPVLTLISASGVVEGADSVCTSAIEDGWVTYYPDHLVDRTTPERLAIAHDWLLESVRSLPGEERERALVTIEARVQAYQTVASLGATVELLATAVALTPALADLLPDLTFRAPDPMDAGATLASGEHAQLRHALAQRLADLSPENRAAVLRELEDKIRSIEQAWTGAE